MKKKKKDFGFTLIELVMSLVLLGSLAVLVSIGFSQMIKGFFFTKNNAQTSLVAQSTISRLAKEFSSIDQVSSGSGTSITYSMVKNGVSVPGQTVTWSGTANDPLYLAGHILAEQVNDFELSYHTSYSDPGDNTWDGTEKMIKITLELTGALDVVSSFSISVAPRNL